MHMNKNGHFLRKNETDIKSNHNGYTHKHTHTHTHTHTHIHTHTRIYMHR